LTFHVSARAVRRLLRHRPERETFHKTEINESKPIDLPCVLEAAHSETPASSIYRFADFGGIK